jgi:hypothetical protein
MEQIYIDRFGSIEEKLAYKKSRKNPAFPAKVDRYGQSVHCGNGITFFAIYGRKIIRHGNEVKFEYRIAADGSNPLDPKWKQQSLTVDA